MSKELIEAARIGNLAKVKELLERGHKVNDGGERGYTPLHSATVRNSTKVMELLLNAGANINLADKDGETPLYSAARLGHIKVMKVLLNAGANINLADKNGKTPLHLTLSCNKRAIAEFLVVHGADITVKTNKGKAVLDMAHNPKVKKSILRGHAHYIHLRNLHSAIIFRLRFKAAKSDKESSLNILNDDVVAHIMNYILGMPVKKFFNNVYGYYQEKGFPSFFKPPIPIGSIPKVVNFHNEEDVAESSNILRLTS